MEAIIGNVDVVGAFANGGTFRHDDELIAGGINGCFHIVQTAKNQKVGLLRKYGEKITTVVKTSHHMSTDFFLQDRLLGCGYKLNH